MQRDRSGNWQVMNSSGQITAMDEAGILSLPDSLMELIKDRLSQLSESASELLKTASLITKSIHPRLLLEVSGLSDKVFLDVTNELFKRHVFEKSKSGVIKFVHSKLREVTCSNILRDEKATLYRRIAQAMEFIDTDELLTDAAERAYHWLEAGERKKAGPYLVKAARLAKKQHDLREAEKLYRLFFSIVTEPPSHIVEVKNEFAFDILQLQGRSIEAKAFIKKALDTSQQLELRTDSILEKKIGSLQDAEKMSPQEKNDHLYFGELRTDLSPELLNYIAQIESRDQL